MDNLIDNKRVSEIKNFLSTLDIESERFKNIQDKKYFKEIRFFDEALTHSSAKKKYNHEKLEFFGDAVLRLAASEFIEKNFNSMSVGKRSELRAQLVSDEWLTKLGKKIAIENIIVVGPKAIGDHFSKDTIIAEMSEALIGALYKCFNSIKEINLWLDIYWEQDSQSILKEPYKFNAKSALQEWCQEKGLKLPEYKIKEVSQSHGDPKRFICELYVDKKLQAISYGKSHKIAEKTAAVLAYEKIYTSKSN